MASEQIHDEHLDMEVSSESPSHLTREKSTPATIEIPNGGFIAWLHVAAAFCIFFNTWGLIDSFGVYQTFYQTHFLSSKTESDLAWIGSIQAFLSLIVSTAAGPFFDAGYLRSLIWTGATLSILGMMLASISKTYWQVLLSQGVVVGIGTGCLFIAAVSLIPQYFSTKKAFAYGITSTGSSIGGVVYPIIFSRLQPSVGFGWATRVMGFVMLAAFVIPLVGMKQRIRPSARRQLFKATLFQDTPFLLLNLAMFFGFMGVYIPFSYVQLYAIEKCNVNEHFSFYLLAIMNASSTAGRVLPNFYADKIGPLNMLTPICFLAALLCFCWMAVKDTIGLIVWSVVYGFFCGCFASMPNSSMMSLTSDLGTMGSRIGMSLGSSGFGFLVGSPIGGALLRSHGGWISLQAWAGLLLALSGVCALAARVSKVGLTFKVKI